MHKSLSRCCSLVLVLAILINLLPVHVLALEDEAQTENVNSGNVADTEPVQILGEVVENRGEYTKEYILSNGLHIATVYSEPVHYEENGQWLEIDNTLCAAVRGDGDVYTNAAGDWSVSFPQQLSGDSYVSVERNGYRLRFALAGAVHTSLDKDLVIASDDMTLDEDTIALHEMTPASAHIQEPDLTDAMESAEYPELIQAKSHSRVEYTDVFVNTDIVYDLTGGQLKESIVIQGYAETLYGYQYVLDMGEMRPILQENGEIWLYDETGKELVLVICAPYLLDDAGEYCDDVTVDLQSINGLFVLTYVLPQEWMADEDRQWPVILDPIIKKEADFQNSEDQTLYENVTMSASEDTVTCGYDGFCGKMRFYWKYNVLPEITSADVIVSANIKLYANECVGSAVIEVHQVEEDWDAEQITWNTQPAFNSNVADFAYCTSAGTSNSFYSWEVTEIVRNWYSGKNYGMVFKLSDAVEAIRDNSWFRFFSSEMVLACMPVMTITFRNNNGLESYWDYTASSAGRAGTGYVNNYTGNLVWVHNDMGFGGNRMPVSISHIYNANDSANNTFGMGYGWRTNYNQRVYHWDHADAALDYYVWEDADGTSHYFYADSSAAGTYRDEDGLELMLTTTGSGTTKYCITDKYGNKSYFDEYGRLSEQRNNQKTPSSITITYTSATDYQIQQITDGAGRVYSFTYLNGSLSSIQYKGNGSEEISAAFGYSGGKLTTITYDDGRYVQYTYAANASDPTKNLISEVTDIDGYKIAYTYTTAAKGMPARVASITEYDGTTVGSALTIAYGHNQTIFTDHIGNVQTMQFNNFGNTIAVMDDLGRAQYAQFAFNTAEDMASNSDNTAKGNQLRLSSKMQNTVGNMLDDGSFEHQLNWATTANTVTSAVNYETAYIGVRSLKLVRYAAGTAAGAQSASFNAEAGSAYTFSAYVKTGTGAVWLEMSDGSTTVKSDTLAANTDWTRLEVTYTNTGTSARTLTARLMTAEAGTTYMDCVQVEKAPSASRYNLADNGDFRFATDWSASDGRTTLQDTAAPELSNNVYMIAGHQLMKKRISQTLIIRGDAGDTFVLSGWAKGYSVPLDAFYNFTREFALIVTFLYYDGTTGTTVVRFNPSVTNWQYAAGVAVATGAFHSMTLEVAYDYNANVAYFDGIQLYKEEFGSSYTYDANGNVVSVEDIQNQTTRYEYSNNNLTKAILPSGAVMTYTYDNYHNVKTATTGTGVTYNFAYDDWGNNTAVSTTSGGRTISTSATYSTDGNRLVSTTDAAGKVTTYGYDADTNVLDWVQYPEDTEATRTEYTYDDLYRLAQAAVTTDTGLNLSAQYTYPDDLLTRIETPSTAYNFTYGDFSLRRTVTIGDRTLAAYSYTNRTNYLSTLDYGNGDKVQYTYDNHGRVTAETYEDGDKVTYRYDNNGAVATVTDSATGITATYYYDFTDRLMKYVESDGTNTHSVSYAYDTVNNLTSLVEVINGTAHTTSYVYNKDNQVTSVTNGTTATTFGYDSFGRVSSRTVKNGSSNIFTASYAYRNPTGSTTTGQVSGLTIDGSGFDVAYSYTYDDNGNILSVSDGTNTTSYVYDTAGQLLTEIINGTRYSYTYDNAGNILTAEKGSQTHTYTYGDDDWGDLLTAYDGESITYDGIGNPTSYYNGTRWTFGWEHGRQLASASNGTTTWNYTYNSDGLRTSRTNGSTTYKYLYNGSSLVQMTVGGNTLYFTDDTVTFNNTVYYYVKNLQGDVIAILNGSGSAVVQYTYDAWGNVLSITGSMADTLGQMNPLRYRGYVYDSETGLYYLQSRYYDPEIGRFINADAFAATGQGVLSNNMFAYCGNNPVNGYDPTGYLRFDVATCSIGDANWGRRHAASMEPIYYMADGVINGQGAFKFSQTAFGMGSYAHNGCGAIAIYNAMQLLGYDISLGMIYDQITNKYGLCMGGLFGIKASVIDDVFAERGITCTGYWSGNDLMQNVQEGNVVILYVMNDASTLFRGFHYVTAQYVGGQFLVYNMYNESTMPKPAKSILQPYGNSCYLYGCIVGG